jgi:hypothetical protein
MISVNKVVPWSELLFERLEAKGWKVGTCFSASYLVRGQDAVDR